MEGAQTQASKEMQEFKAEVLARLDRHAGSRYATGTVPKSSTGLPNGSRVNLLSVTDLGYFRTPDTPIVLCDATEDVCAPRSELHAAILTLAIKAGLDGGAFNLVWDPVDNGFEMKLCGVCQPHVINSAAA